MVKEFATKPAEDMDQEEVIMVVKVDAVEEVIATIVIVVTENTMEDTNIISIDQTNNKIMLIFNS